MCLADASQRRVIGRMAQAPQNQRVLGVFAKQPLPGQVKTRLAAAASLVSYEMPVEIC